MPHRFRVRQAVALAKVYGVREIFEVVRLLPEDPSGRPQYRLRAVIGGGERVAREDEIRPA
jgi:hypothetical protein